MLRSSNSIIKHSVKSHRLPFIIDDLISSRSSTTPPCVYTTVASLQPHCSALAPVYADLCNPMKAALNASVPHLLLSSPRQSQRQEDNRPKNSFTIISAPSRISLSLALILRPQILTHALEILHQEINQRSPKRDLRSLHRTLLIHRAG